MHDAVERFVEFFGLVRFDNAATKSILLKFDDNGIIGIAAGHHGFGVWIYLKDLFDRFLASHASWNGQIHEDDIERRTRLLGILIEGNGFRAIPGKSDVVAVVSQHVSGDVTDDCLIFHNEDTSCASVLDRLFGFGLEKLLV